jgi:hypothetical protein
MKDTIKKVLTHSVFKDNPTVLVDIGASGEIHKKWNLIAPYSICIAYDADSRDFEVLESEKSGYKKLLTINRLVSPDSEKNKDFWLTKSPHCSSSLEPDNSNLKYWSFAPLFDVEKKVQIDSVGLVESLSSAGINYIDWYKSDSQGTDLRLFNSLHHDLIKNIHVAEFEPGILDGYIDEDKLFDLMKFMHKHPFWVQDMVIKGSHRLHREVMQSSDFLTQKCLRYGLKISPGWCEITYLRNEVSLSTKRDFLTSWVFGMISYEYGFAFDVASEAEKRFDDDIFSEMKAESLNSLRASLPKVLFKLFTRGLKKCISSV